MHHIVWPDNTLNSVPLGTVCTRSDTLVTHQKTLKGGGPSGPLGSDRTKCLNLQE